MPQNNEGDQPESPANKSELPKKSHRILFMESDIKLMDESEEFLKEEARQQGIEDADISFVKHHYPPASEGTFKKLLRSCTSSVLHNLSVRNMNTLIDFVQVNPDLAAKMVVLSSRTIPDQHLDLYKQLESYGVTVLQKPMNAEQVAKVIFKK